MQGASKDVLFLIFSHLSARDVLALGATSRRMNAESKTVALWRWLLERDFGLTNMQDPFTVYVEEYGFTQRHGRCREHNCLAAAASSGVIGDIKAALRRGMDPTTDKNYPIRIASQEGHTEIVRLLLQDKRVDPSDYGNDAFINAVCRNHLEIVCLLLQDKRIDPNTSDNYAIYLASCHGYCEMLKLLLADSRTTINQKIQNTIWRAAHDAQAETVRILVADSRVSSFIEFEREAVEWAAENGHTNLVDILLGKYTSPGDAIQAALWWGARNKQPKVAEILRTSKKLKK